jgi:hypothetical protein
MHEIGLGYSSVTECLPFMPKALGLIPNTAKKIYMKYKSSHN